MPAFVMALNKINNALRNELVAAKTPSQLQIGRFFIAYRAPSETYVVAYVNAHRFGSALVVELHSGVAVDQ